MKSIKQKIRHILLSDISSSECEDRLERLFKRELRKEFIQTEKEMLRDLTPRVEVSRHFRPK